MRIPMNSSWSPEIMTALFFIDADTIIILAESCAMVRIWAAPDASLQKA